MKKIYLTLVLILSVFVCNAQSEDPTCREAFEKAKKVYEEKGKEEGIESFKLVFGCGDAKISKEANEWLADQERINPNNFKYLKTLEGHPNLVNYVCWSSDGKYLASGSSDKTLIIWDAKSGEKLKTLEGHSDEIKSVSWSPDGKYLASGSSQFNGEEYIGCIKIWDVIGAKEIQTLYRHSSGVESVSWSPDGKYLASGSDDGTIKIWGVE